MVGHVDPVFATPVVVGRDRELHAFIRLIERAGYGEGSVLLISGEAGIGKSRLISELLQQVKKHASDSILVLQGNCFEGDRDYPGAPLRDIFRRWAAQRPREFEQIAGTLLGDVSLELDFATAQILPAGQDASDPDQRQILHLLSNVIARGTEGSRLLLIIEDLHWADEVTLEAMPRLTRTAVDHGALVVLSYRSDEVDPVLQHVLATLDRAPSTVEYLLNPLDRHQIDTMLRTMFGQPQPIRADFLDTIHELTDGNPFFIEEVIRALITSGDIFLSNGVWSRKETSEIQVPRGVHDAVWRRARTLSPEARELLGLAAVIGRQFSFTVIQQMTGRDEASLLEQLRELIDRQLILEESSDQFTFRHALTREAVYTQLLRRERQHLHRSIAETIERMVSPSRKYQAAELAYHYYTAGHWEKAYSFAVEAGDRALRLFAPRSAAEQFSRALSAGAHLGRSPEPEIYRKRAEAWVTLGQFEQAREDYMNALEIVRASSDRQHEWAILLGLGRLWTGLDYDRAGDYFRRAHELAREMKDERAEAMSLLQLGNWQVNVERLDEANDSLTQALAGFESLHDRRGRAEALDLLGVVADASGDIVQMMAYYLQAMDLYEELDDRKGVVSTGANVAVTAGAYTALGAISLRGGTPASEARATGERIVSLARELDWRSGESYALMTIGSHYVSQGSYDEGQERIQRSLEVAVEINHHEWTAAACYFLGYLHADLFDSTPALDFFKRGYSVALESGSLWMQRLLCGGLSACLIDCRSLDQAARLLQPIDDHVPMHTMGIRLLWLSKARLHLARGEASAGLDIIDRLFATARNYHEESDIPLLAKYRAECLTALARVEEAHVSLEAAREGAMIYGLRPLQWRIYAQLAALYHSAGDTSAANSAQSEAWTIVESLASDIADPVLRAGFISGATDRIVQSAGTRGKLTPREREVAALIARGMSNREVADALYIGERTVETHVGNVLAKLNLSSRLQVATWMLQSDAETGKR